MRFSARPGSNKKNTPTLVAEQQADCFAGAYMRWVAEDNSPRFTLSTGDGLNSVLAAVISFRDPLLSEDDYDSGEGEHGSAFERITAFQFGFTDGAASCAAIDAKEIAQRRGDLPVELQQDQTGEWPVSEESVKAIVDALGTLFSPADPPKLSLDADSANDCPDARPSPPVSYCPATNTIAVDMSELEAMGAPSGQDENGGVVSGDNTAYSVLVSRYMLALQHERGGLALDNAEAALRTACLTGVATTKMTEAVTTSDGNTVALTAGDLDEAVSGSAHQRAGGQRRQRRDGAVRLLPDGRIPHRRARRRGPLLQAVPVDARSLDLLWSRRSSRGSRRRRRSTGSGTRTSG